MVTADDIINAGMEAPDELEAIKGLKEAMDKLEDLNKLTAGLEDGLVDRTFVKYVNEHLPEEARLGLESFTSVPSSVGVGLIKDTLANVYKQAGSSILERIEYIKKLIADNCGCGHESLPALRLPIKVPIYALDTNSVVTKVAGSVTVAELHNTVSTVSALKRISIDDVLRAMYTAIPAPVCKAAIYLYDEEHSCRCGGEDLPDTSSLRCALAVLNTKLSYLKDDVLEYLTKDDGGEFWDSVATTSPLESTDKVTLRDLAVVYRLLKFKPDTTRYEDIVRITEQDSDWLKTAGDDLNRYTRSSLSEAIKLLVAYKEVKEVFGNK